MADVCVRVGVTAASHGAECSARGFGARHVSLICTGGDDAGGDDADDGCC